MDSLPKIAKSEDLAMVCHQVAERVARILSDFAKRCPQPGAASDELGTGRSGQWLFRSFKRSVGLSTSVGDVFASG